MAIKLKAGNLPYGPRCRLAIQIYAPGHSLLAKNSTQTPLSFPAKDILFNHTAIQPPVVKIDIQFYPPGKAPVPYSDSVEVSKSSSPVTRSVYDGNPAKRVLSYQTKLTFTMPRLVELEILPYEAIG